MKVLVVEDNTRLRSLILSHLERVGFTVDGVRTLADAEAALSVASYDIMLLDLGLPDGNGASLLRNHAASPGKALPVVVVTARDELPERLRLLNAGADDFIVKPFEVLELEARLRAVLRRPGLRTSEQLLFGDVLLDVRSREATCQGRRVLVGRRELGLLEELMRANGKIVVRDALEDRLYTFSDPVTPNALEQSISRLRKALTAAGAMLAIETKRGIGYRLVEVV